MPTYKLYYFDLMGRAEILRLMFAEAGVEYVDKRFSWQEWPAIKPEMPFGHVPVLYVDGKPLAETRVIVRYLAREFNLVGDSSWEKAYVDMLYETVADVISQLPVLEQDPEKKKAIAADVITNKICPVLEKIEKQFKTKGSDYLVGKSLTYLDIGFMHMVCSLDKFDSSVIDKYPALKAVARRVQDRPNIKKWIATRPKTKDGAN